MGVRRSGLVSPTDSLAQEALSSRKSLVRNGGEPHWPRAVIEIRSSNIAGLYPGLGVALKCVARLGRRRHDRDLCRGLD